MPIFKSNNLFIDYEVTEPLFPKPTVLLHGNMASRRWWLPLLHQARQAPKSNVSLFPAVLIDFPGCGQSPTPEDSQLINVGAYSLGFLNLIQSLANQWKTESFCLIGHSTGGLIANLMMSEANRIRSHENLFHGAIMINAVGPQGLKKVALLDKLQVLRTDPKQLFSMMTTTLHYKEEHREFVEQIAVPEAKTALDHIQGKLLESMMGRDFSEDFQRVSQKVLILFGEKDTVLPKQHAEQMRDVIPNSKLIFIPDAGHSLNVENPKQLLQHIFEFC